MNFSTFISTKVFSRKKNSFSAPFLRIATGSVMIGITVMIVAICILNGYQEQIRNKIIGFNGHVQILKFNSTSAVEAEPFIPDQKLYDQLNNMPEVAHIQSFASKAGIMKHGEDFEGIVFKGIHTDFDTSFFGERIIEGQFITIDKTKKSNGILVSSNMANKLNLHIGDTTKSYFIDEKKQLRGRKLFVEGIYSTGMEEMDNMFVLCDIKHIQKVNRWDNNEIGGIEIILNDFNKIDQAGYQINGNIDYNLKAETIKDLYPQIFDWLNVLDQNVYLILILMLIVSIINMISFLLIIILEKTNLIGILKAMGAQNKDLRIIFLRNSIKISIRGLILGNILAFVILILQNQFHIIQLDPESYYMDAVPVSFNYLHIILINITTFIICILMMLIPSSMISRISPLKTIQYK